MNLPGPSRIVCLSDESTEILYLLGEQNRIAGISGFSIRPAQARIDKPKISGFTSAKIEKILALKPDLVLGFSNLQSEIAKELIQAGTNVLVFNQHSVEEIFAIVLILSRIVGTEARGLALIEELRYGLDRIARSAAGFAFRPRVFFEEWNEPLISGSRWVEELIQIAGGQPAFPDLRPGRLSRERVVQPGDVIAANPEVIIASWCGRKVVKTEICGRAGWENIAAVRRRHVYEVKSAYILQPGPAALTEGVRQLHAILAQVAGCKSASDLLPEECVDPDLLDHTED